MKKITVITLGLFFLLAGFKAEAGGCCSHHGGVCGCSNGRDQCCDGSLSPSCTCTSSKSSKSAVSTPSKVEKSPSKVKTDSSLQLKVIKQANVKKAPDPQSEIILTLEAGTIVKKTGFQMGEWLQIEFNGQKGWIQQTMVTSVSETSKKKSEEPLTETVYVTKTGKKYHRENCRFLSSSKIPIPLTEAKQKGYTPCSACKPPE